VTSNMREALETAAKAPLRRVHDQDHGSARWPAPAVTLYALRRRGLVDYIEIKSRQGNLVQEWRINDAGKQALQPPKLVGTEKPVFPAKGGGTTSDWTRAVDHDPKMGALDEMGAPSEAWLRVARVKFAGAQDSRKAASRAARSLKAA
jgi:hypothetical protein